jgi:hypothetical protein
MSEALDKLAVDADAIDDRLSITRPTCFLCGKRITRLNFVTVQSAATTPYHAHAECAHAVGGPQAFAQRVWSAVIAAMTGKPEAPAPGVAKVSGRFM